MYILTEDARFVFFLMGQKYYRIQSIYVPTNLKSGFNGVVLMNVLFTDTSFMFFMLVEEV